MSKRVVLKHLAATAFVALGAASAPVSAELFLENWIFNPSGVGGAAAGTRVNEYLDLVGPGFVSTSMPIGNNFTFTEWGAFAATGRDSLLGFPGFTGQVTALFNVSGSGNLGGSVMYAPGGTVRIWSSPTVTFGSATGTYGADQGTLIATLQIAGGGGAISTAGIPNGTQTIIASVQSMAPGYWFSGAGQDLSTLAGDGLLLGFGTTNASYASNPNSLIASEFLPLFPAGTTFTNCLPGQTSASGPPCTGTTGQGSFIISNNGQFRLQVIPEPSTYALLGAGLLVLGYKVRRGSRLSDRH